MSSSNTTSFVVAAYALHFCAVVMVDDAELVPVTLAEVEAEELAVMEGELVAVEVKVLEAV